MQEEKKKKKSQNQEDIKQRLLDLSANSIGNIFNTSVGINKSHKVISAVFFFLFFLFWSIPRQPSTFFGINAAAVR